MIKWYAHKRGIPYFSFAGSEETTKRDLLGSWVIQGDKPVLSPSQLIQAIVHGGVFHFEEIGPVSQEVLYTLHPLLDSRKITLQTQYGPEVLQAHPNFKFVASGNLSSGYTINRINQAFLRRFAKINLEYPPKDMTVEIIKSRAPGLHEDTAKFLTDLTFDLRKEAEKYGKDIGIGGPVEVAQRIVKGTRIDMYDLIKAYMINAPTTYEDGELEKKLDDVVRRYL
jgi:MoxR-like ATPase